MSNHLERPFGLIKRQALRKEALKGASGVKRAISALINGKNTLLAKKLPGRRATLKDITNNWRFLGSDNKVGADMRFEMPYEKRKKLDSLLQSVFGDQWENNPYKTRGYLWQKFNARIPDNPAKAIHDSLNNPLPWYRRFNREANSGFEGARQEVRKEYSRQLGNIRNRKTTGRLFQNPDTIKDLFK